MAQKEFQQLFENSGGYFSILKFGGKFNIQVLPKVPGD